MLYKSTRGKIRNVPFKDVLFSGLAPDGGLYIPEKLPDPQLFNIKTFSEKKYEEIAQIILKPFVGSFFDNSQFTSITDNAYSKELDFFKNASVDAVSYTHLTLPTKA